MLSGLKKLKRWATVMGSLHFRYERDMKGAVPIKKMRDILWWGARRHDRQMEQVSPRSVLQALARCVVLLISGHTSSELGQWKQWHWKFLEIGHAMILLRVETMKKEQGSRAKKETLVSLVYRAVQPGTLLCPPMAATVGRRLQSLPSQLQ